MMNLPNDLNISILSNLNFFEIQNMMTVNKYYFINCYHILIEAKKKYFQKNLPHKIYKLIENYDFQKIRYLDFKERFIGMDYIDRIRVNDVNSSIMYTIDHFDRPCLIFLINIKNNKENFDIVHALFQRYSDCKDKWVFGTCYPTYNIYNQALPTDDDLFRIKNLIEKDILNINNYQISL
jgi:hypothetical protein